MAGLVDSPQHKDQEVLPLLHTLQLGRSSSLGSSSKQHQLPFRQRAPLFLKSFTPELLAIALVYFVQGILKLSSLAVTFFFKDDLKLEPAQMALADTIAAVPWAVKPLYGFITDSFPIMGMRRRPYLILAGLLGSIAWLCLAGLATSVTSAVGCITVAAMATAFSDVVADSIVVQLARESPGTTEGALQSMCWGSHAFGRVITAYLSGWLVGKLGPRPVFVATASFPLIVCASSCLIQEGVKPSTTPETRLHASGTRRAAPDSYSHHHQLVGECDGLSKEAGVSTASCSIAGVSSAHHEVLQASDVSGHGPSPMLSRQGSSEVVLSQLQLTHGQLHHKHRLGFNRTHSFEQQQQYTPRSQHDQTRFAAAGSGLGTLPPAAAASDGLMPGAALSSTAAAQLGGSSGLHKAEFLQQVLKNMLRSIRLFWNAVQQPHMLRPVVFLFLFQAMPQPDSAMFYFKTNKLGFDAEFFGRVKLVAALADLAGLAVYNAFLKSVRLRPLLLWGALLGCAMGLTPLLLVEGVNRKLGISDRLFAMVDSALLASIGQVLMMPTLVLCARLCPEGVEATLYASLMSLNNAAIGVGSLLGALMMNVFGITSSSFVHLSGLLLTCNLMSLLPLPLVGWVPDSSTTTAVGMAADAGPAARLSQQAVDVLDSNTVEAKQEGVCLLQAGGDVELGARAFRVS